MIGVEKLQDIRERLEAAVAGADLPASAAGGTEVADALVRFLRRPSADTTVEPPTPAAPDKLAPTA